ncbi:hypothetical protein T11_13385 [Trichinella zimbabwensis]|uniref:Uncharacterized protein n=1 Tax=Trichinella zimbabwensis TaxID=268475 RepID=A0A0V1GKT9_9BILA|nr:hypothetical protein T11_13385 [Trichinella zimbabwensis]
MSITVDMNQLFILIDISKRWLKRETANLLL